MNWLAFWKCLFFMFLVGHIIHSVIVARMGASGDSSEDTHKTPRSRLAGFLTQLPLLYISCGFGFFTYHVFSRELISPLHIGLGLLVGHLIFGISLLITHRNLRDCWEHFIDLGDLWMYTMESPIVLGRFALVAFAEEMIWRVAFQSMAVAWLGGLAGAWGVYGAIFIAAFLFSVAHRHFFENSFMVSLEFLGFAILLGLLYHWTGSFILVIVVHALRDIEITYLEYVIKREELGDSALAAREVESTILKIPRAEIS